MWLLVYKSALRTMVDLTLPFLSLSIFFPYNLQYTVHRAIVQRLHISNTHPTPLPPTLLRMIAESCLLTSSISLVVFSSCFTTQKEQCRTLQQKEEILAVTITSTSPRLLGPSITQYTKVLMPTLELVPSAKRKAVRGR